MPDVRSFIDGAQRAPKRQPDFLRSARYSTSGYAFTSSYRSASAIRPSRALLRSELINPAIRAFNTVLGPMRETISGGANHPGVVKTCSFRNCSAAFCFARGTTRNTAPA